VKLRCRAEASNARNPLSDGSLAVIFGGLLCMSLYHAKRYKVSFVESADNTNITGNKLALGAQNVHILASINDK
jgi:hypothetical protein